MEQAACIIMRAAFSLLLDASGGSFLGQMNEGR